VRENGTIAIRLQASGYRLQVFSRGGAEGRKAMWSAVVGKRFKEFTW
jgi:hypothetical protein